MYRRVEARTGIASPVRAFFLCALVASRFWGGPIFHTGQLPAVNPPLMETVLGGESMAAPSQTLALPCYARSDYPALLEVFSDSNRLPTTYDAWLKRAEKIEQHFQSAGFKIARVWIRPTPFAAWCKEQNVSPDQVARMIFVSDATRLTIMPSDTETLALELLRCLYDATDGLPQQWRMLEELEAASTLRGALTR
jgi:hypothetical protein